MTLLLKRLNLMVGDSSQGLTPGRHKQDVIKKKKRHEQRRAMNMNSSVVMPL